MSIDQKDNDRDTKTQNVIENVSEYGGVSRKEWWVNKFKKKPVIYKAQYGYKHDVRNFVFPRSYIFDDAIKRFNLKDANDTTTVYRCFLYVLDTLKYVSDTDSKSQNEFWQYPEETFARRTGDCEDGAILLKSMTLCAGVPDWKVKIIAGEVKGGGHAYCTYIRDDDTQIILDWCYWPNKLPIDKRPDLLDEPNYKDIWFSFNNKYSYAECKVTYAKGKIKNKGGVVCPQ
jgi:hypothetical protein